MTSPRAGARSLLLAVTVAMAAAAGCLDAPTPPTCADDPTLAGCVADDPDMRVEPDVERADAAPPADGTPQDGALPNAKADAALAPDGRIPPDGGSDDAALPPVCEPGTSEPCADDDSVCGFGRRFCNENGQWSSCVRVDEQGPELCNNADDDCDGTVDEGLDRPCGSDLGQCVAGVDRCVGGRWRCEGAVTPDPESCEGGIDEDCDGTVDEGCPCADDGTLEPCGTDEGACAFGERRCSAGAWSACVGGTGPSGERCDGVDDDCDGAIDEGLQRPCGVDVGTCAPGVEVCVAGDWGPCEDAGGPIAEACNGLDDDCDGEVDEGADVPCGSSVGVCEPGLRRCADGVLGGCITDRLPGDEDEACVAGLLDEDCDGVVDEGCPCISGEVRPCGNDVGRCVAGRQTCTGESWGACAGATAPLAETCNDADDDCDGTVDEGYRLGEDCTDGLGRCRADGVRVCDGFDGTRCQVRAPILPVIETCNGVDDDCDGTTDEGITVFETDEVRLGPALDPGAVSVRIAAVEDRFGVAWRGTRVAFDPAGGPQVETVLELRLLDARGRALPGLTPLTTQGDATALDVSDANRDGQIALAVAWADEDDAGSALRVWFGQTDDAGVTGEVGPLTVWRGAPVDALTVDRGNGGLGFAFVSGGMAYFGHLFDGRGDLADVTPLGPALGAARPDIAWNGEKFVIAWRHRTGDGPDDIYVTSIRRNQPPTPMQRLVRANNLGGPSVTGDGAGLIVRPQFANRVRVGRLRPVDAEGVPIAEAADVTQRLGNASSTTLASGGGRFGLVWNDNRDGNQEVYFVRLQPLANGRWARLGSTVQISSADSTSSRPDLTVGEAFGVVWYDERNDDPGYYLRLGTFGCPGPPVDLGILQ